MSELTENKSGQNDNEIDLIEVARQIWAGRKIILYTTVLFVVLGGLYILLKKLTNIPEYESNVTLNVDSPSPDLLPKLITSASFMTEVLKIRLIHPGRGQSETVLEVLRDHTRPPQGNLAGLMSRVSTKTGKADILIVSVVMQDPMLATQLTDSIAQKLAPFLETYKPPRTMKNLEYLASRYRDAESAYLHSLKVLSDFYDQNAENLHIMDTIAAKRLRAESDLKFDIYRAMAQQIENSKIREQEQIPIYDILEPATSSNQINLLKTEKILLLMLFLGLIAGVVLLFGKKFYDKFSIAAT